MSLCKYPTKLTVAKKEKFERPVKIAMVAKVDLMESPSKRLRNAPSSRTGSRQVEQMLEYGIGNNDVDRGIGDTAEILRAARNAAIPSSA
jgi:hypothetical protein